MSECQRCAERDEDDAYQRAFAICLSIDDRETRLARIAELDAQYPAVVARSEERTHRVRERLREIRASGRRTQ